MRGRRLGRFWWLGVILLIVAVALLFKVIDWFASPHTFRLAVHYSAKAKLAGPIDTRQLYPEDLKRLEEGDPAVFTEAGLFLYEQGSSFYQADEQEAVIAFRDWRGRRRWSVTVPQGTFRGCYASPNGRYLATFCYGRGSSILEVWRDGKSVYDWIPETSGSGQGVRIDNDGQLFVWYDGKLSVIQDGEVIASNPNLQPSVWTGKTRVEYHLAPDGTAMAGLVYTICRPDDDYSRPHPGPYLDYVPLTIRGNKVVATHRLYKNITSEGSWSFLPGGDLLFTDGTLYARNGQQRSNGAGWIPTMRFAGEGSGHLWHGEALIEVQLPSPVTMNAGAPLPSFTPRFRVNLPRAGRTWQLPQEVLSNSGSSDRFAVSASGDGRYALAVTYHNQYPPTMTSRLARACSGNATLRTLFGRVPKNYAQFKLYDQSGKQKAQMLCPVTDFEYDAAPVIKVGKRKYAMLNHALSQDGSHLVVLAQSLTGHDREYLHFAW
ncbi:MAG: hypothetical protein ACYC6A_08895 [Armatimonadota bacterium]